MLGQRRPLRPLAAQAVELPAGRARRRHALRPDQVVRVPAGRGTRYGDPGPGEGQGFGGLRAEGP